MAGDSRVGVGFRTENQPIFVQGRGMGEREEESRTAPASAVTGELGLTTTALFQSNPVHGIVIKALYNPHPSQFYFSM